MCPPGFWDTRSYDVYAMFKCDWTVVGGFNVEKHSREDRDILDRLVENSVH